MAPSRPRFRRISGPLAFLPDDPPLREGELFSDTDPQQQRAGFAEGGLGRTVGATSAGTPPPEVLSPFNKGPWLCLCEELNITVPSGNSAGTSIREAIGTTVSDVLEGKCFLRVPKLVVVASSVIHNGDGSVSVNVMDPTGSISGYIHEDLIEEYGPDLVAGFAMALSNVSILMSGPGVQRLLNITPSNVISFFPKSMESDRTVPEKQRMGLEQQEEDAGVLRPVPELPSGGGGEVGTSMRAEERVSRMTRKEDETGGMFGWQSEERRVEAISVLSSSVTRPGAVVDRVWGADTGVAEEKQQQQQQEVARSSWAGEEGEEERRGPKEVESSRRDIWSMDMEEEEEEELAETDFFSRSERRAPEPPPPPPQQQHEQPTLPAVPLASSGRLVREAADWVIGDDRVLREAGAPPPRTHHQRDDAYSLWRGEEEERAPTQHGLYDDDQLSTALTDTEMTAAPTTSGQKASMGEEEPFARYQDVRHHDRPAGSGYISRFAVSQDRSGGGDMMNVEDDLLGGILEEDEMLW